MKKLFNFQVILVCTSLFTLFVSCKDSGKEVGQIITDAVKDEEAMVSAGPWAIVFADYFNNTGSFNQWERTDRFDHNSNFCDYDASIPTIETRDGKTVLVLTATKSGNIYKSGHVKSFFNFKPAVNEEYRVISNIKMIAQDGANFKGFNQTYGAWPAFWTVQETAWPKKGEIDIMEGYSYSTYSRFASNLFYGNAANQNLLGNTCEQEYAINEGWHKYEQYWKNENGWVTVTIKVDNATVKTYTNNINGNLQLQNFGPHNIILNLNVGDNKSIFNEANINLFSKTMMWVDNVVVEKRSL